MGYPRDTCIRTNKEIDTQRERISADPAMLPITLEQAKTWLKMDEITDDDVTIQDLISEAVDWVEMFCGVCIVPQVVTAYLEVNNKMELPYGPVVDITTINGAAYVADECLIFPAAGFSQIHGHGRYTLVYNAGYTTIPPSLLGALKGYIAYAYEHRGDAFDEDSVEFAKVCKSKAFPFTRNVGF